MDYAEKQWMALFIRCSKLVRNARFQRLYFQIIIIKKR